MEMNVYGDAGSDNDESPAVSTPSGPFQVHVLAALTVQALGGGCQFAFLTYEWSLHDHVSVENTDGPQHRFDPHHHGRGCE